MLLPLAVYVALHLSVIICPPGYIAEHGPDNGTVCESPDAGNWLGAVALTEGKALANERSR
jgi:hypothetical protein